METNRIADEFIHRRKSLNQDVDLNSTLKTAQDLVSQLQNVERLKQSVAQHVEATYQDLFRKLNDDKHQCIEDVQFMIENAVANSGGMPYQTKRRHDKAGRKLFEARESLLTLMLEVIVISRVESGTLALAMVQDYQPDLTMNIAVLGQSPKNIVR
eukprot:g7927.t1